MINEEDEETAEKPEHPQKGATWLSILTFWYTIPLFRIGRKRDFNDQDLTKPLDEFKASELGKKFAILWSKEVHRAKEHHEIPMLARVMSRMIMKDVIVQGVWLFIIEVPIRLCQPFFLGLLVRYFSSENQKSPEPRHEPLFFMRIVHYYTEQSPVELDEAFVFATGVFFCTMANVVITHPCMMAAMNTGMKLRLACCSLIYRKTLRLDLSTLSGSAHGTIVNLMSNDVTRFDVIMIYFHYLWIGPLQMLVCLLLMYRQVGMSAVFGITTILAFIPIQAWFGNRTSRFRLKTAYRTDERVRQMYEIFQGMQVIKMYTWEYAFAKQTHDLRRLEMKALRETSYIRGAIMSFIMFTTRLAIFVTILGLLFRKKGVTAEKIFIVISFYQILRQTMTLFFPYGISQIAETNVAVTRINQFLILPESDVGDRRNLDPIWHPSKQEILVTEPKIQLTNVFAKIEEEMCLQNVSLEIGKGQLTAVIGQVGSGKSSLLHAILGELKPYLGSVSVKGTISYASDEPWLFMGTVRQNILFGRKYDRFRYSDVVKACALKKDFDLFPFGDDTVIGERGTSLSGGQRARINLARAVYKEADIYLLDDPLSAVDVQVGKHLFDKCVCHFLSGKIVILATHQLQFLSEVTKVVLMDNGRKLAEGSYTFLQNTDFDFAEYLRNQLAVDIDELETPRAGSKISLLMQDLLIRSSLGLGIIERERHKMKHHVESEIRSQGSVGRYVYKEYFKAGGNCCAVFNVFALFVAAQALASIGDFFLATWVDLEELHTANISDSEHSLRELSTVNCIQVYTVAICLTVIAALTRSFIFFRFCMKISMNLHDRMLQSIITGSMHFFNTTSSGRILNRFSKDLGVVDELLPNAIMDCTQILLNLLGSIVIVINVNYLLLIPTVVMCVGFYFLRSHYLMTSRSTKRLEGTSRSPVFAHLNSTIQGLATIRSNGAEAVLTEEFDHLQDNNSSAWFMFIATSRAFGFWLDLICAFYIGIIAYSFLMFSITGSSIGLAITTVIGLTGTFQWGMKQSAEVENQMTSVERVLEYIRIEHEADLESKPDKRPPPDWPSKGKIEFINVVMRYNPQDPPTLKHLTFLIHPQEKIGIVGRTGAGKSSLMAALFRLASFEGSVLIDDVNTSEIGRHDLRSRISIIPQEPFLFFGTLRHNMDPFNQYDDETILNALKTVECKAALAEGVDCLKHVVLEGGVNISVGERQLICLARAVLHNNRILVLDEATANIDPKTDKFIQTIIRQKFAQCTVLTIAHRLHTIMDSDRILVMDAGEVVEFEHPHILLRNEFGIFLGMVEKTGKAMANHLKEMAKKNYERNYGPTSDQDSLQL